MEKVGCSSSYVYTVMTSLTSSLKGVSTKSKAGDLITYLKPKDANISEEQLKMFISCYSSESQIKRELLQILSII